VGGVSQLTKSPFKRVRGWIGTLVTPGRAADRAVSQKARTSSIGTISDRFTKT
jgi:hypothetical protein